MGMKAKKKNEREQADEPRSMCREPAPGRKRTDISRRLGEENYDIYWLQRGIFLVNLKVICHARHHPTREGSPLAPVAVPWIKCTQ